MARGRAALVVGPYLFGIGASHHRDGGFDILTALHMRSPDMEMPPTEEISWFCYKYAFGQNDAWCAATSHLGALEFSFSATGARQCGGRCHCCVRAATVSAVAPLPPPAGSTVEFVTAETRRKAVELWLVPGVRPKNVGYGKDFGKEGLKIKTRSYKEYLTRVKESHPTKLVVLLDADIGWGGCSEIQLLDRYHAVAEASGGAKIVAGADPFQWPRGSGLHKLKGAIEEMNGPKLKPVLEKLGLDVGAWDAFLPSRGNTRNEYIFFNSGFLMGPVKDLLWLVECTMENGDAPDGVFHDQLGVARCAMKNPGTVTVDYSSLIVAETNCMRNNLVQIQGNRILNNLFGETQCFVHADGGSSDTNQMKAWFEPATAVLKKHASASNATPFTVGLKAAVARRAPALPRSWAS